MFDTIKSVSIVDLRVGLSELLGEVFYAKQPVLIERHGKPMAVLIHPDEFARFRSWQDEQNIAHDHE